MDAEFEYMLSWKNPKEGTMMTQYGISLYVTHVSRHNNTEMVYFIPLSKWWIKQWIQVFLLRLKTFSK